MLHLHWHEFKFDIPNLDELLAKHRQHGGFIIQYDRVFSILVYTRRTAICEWVPNRAARYRAGLKHALWCGLLGWWSLAGLFVTGVLIFNNLLGGIDYTRYLTTPPLLPGVSDQDSARREVEAAERRRLYLMLVCLYVVLAFVFLVIYG